MKVATRIIELDPGWLLVTFKGDKPPLPSRPYWLRRSLADWIADHPGKKVERTQPIQHGGELIGLMAWMDKPPVKRVPFRLHRSVKMPTEHLEALLHHAYGIYFKDTSGANLVVVNRGGVAVVFDSEAAHVLPFEKLPVDDKLKAEYAEWRTSGKSNYFGVRLPAGFRAK
jgi:hypothetical protein